MFGENGGPSATKPTVVSMKIVPEIVVPAPIPLNVPETSKATGFALATPTPRARAHAVASATLRFDFIVAILRGGHQRHLVDMQCQVRARLRRRPRESEPLARGRRSRPRRSIFWKRRRSP